MECRSISNNQLLWNNKFIEDNNSFVLYNLKCYEGENLYFTFKGEAQQTYLSSLNLITGKYNWIDTIQVEHNQIPVIDSNYIYVVAEDHQSILKINKLTGKNIEVIKLKKHYILDSLQIWKGRIYFCDSRNEGIYYIEI